MEEALIRWMCDLVGYPAEASGDLTSGGSVATLYISGNGEYTSVDASADFLQKPFSSDALLLKVNTLLNSQAA